MLKYQLAPHLEWLIGHNLEYLRAHPNTPKLYDSEVRFFHDPTFETIRDISQVIKHGEGDLEELIAWRMAELALQGEKALIEPIFAYGSLRSLRIRRADGTAEAPDHLLYKRELEADRAKGAKK